MEKNIVVVGGGAAGFFAALSCAEKNPHYQITILEKGAQLLQKVKISGGGRCNVTHHCFEPKQLVKNYPRGERELLGPFTGFGPKDVVEWFSSRGVKIKAEEDGRMFPVTDSSQTIIDCFMREAKAMNIAIRKGVYINSLSFLPAQQAWQVATNGNELITADAVIVATGSALSVWDLLAKLGHRIVPPVPSLFTFNIADERIKGLEGLSVEFAVVNLAGNAKLQATGPLLITHWGMSGPAILRLSAWGARKLAHENHQFEIEVNWLGKSVQETSGALQHFMQAHPKKNVTGNSPFNIPKRLWERLATSCGVNNQLNFADLSKKQMTKFVSALTQSKFKVQGKSIFKEEFVTAGGVALAEVDFKTMQSKKLPGLFFAGEVLDIDAITGGFNFQAAWTTGWIAANAV